MQAVILAGWKMTTEINIPDSLIDVEGRPFMEYQLELLKEYSVTDIIVCPGYLGENIHFYFSNSKDFGLNIRYSDNIARDFGTGGILKKSLSLLESHFYVLYGDSYFPINYSGIMDFFKKSGKMGLFLVYKDHDFEKKGSIIISNRLVKDFDPQNQEKDMPYKYSNVCILAKKIFNLLSGEQFIALEDIFKYLIERDELLSFEISKPNIEISTQQGFDQFKKYMNNPVNFL